MKKLSKIVALLLAGAMAMLMFTACSGGGGSADTQKEEAIRKQLGTKREAAEQYVTVTLSADYKTAGLVAGLVNLITEKLGKIDATNSNVKLDTEWAKAAVVVRTNEKGSYAAIAIQVKNLNYPKT